MRIKLITASIVSMFVAACAQKTPTPSEFANTVVEEYNQHSSISYDVDYQIKFFSQADDTNKVSAKIELIKVPKDSVLGGIVWIEADSSARYYDLEHSYYIIHPKKKIIRYAKDKPFIITGNIIGEAIRTYFLDPNRLINGVNDSTIEKQLVEDKLEPHKLLKWTYLFPDDGEYSKTSKQMWFNMEDFTIQKMTYTSSLQSESQYNRWDLSNATFDSVTKEELKDRFNKLLDTYEIEDHKEMTAKERAPLVNGTEFPQLKGVIFPNMDSTALKELKGKVTLIDFWYMDCAPCITAIPHLNKLHQKYSDKGLAVVGVNPFDNNKKSLKRFPNFLENNEFAYPILFTERVNMEKFKVLAYPTLYLLDENETVIFSQVGFGEQLPTAIDSLIEVNLKKL